MPDRMPLSSPASTPDRAAFARLAAQADLVPMLRAVLSDQLTPVLAYRRLVHGDERMAPSFLYESVEAGERLGRYSYLAAAPAQQLVAYGHTVTHTVSQQATTYACDDPLGEAARLTRPWRVAHFDGLPGFSGGWVGYAGYDTVRYLEGEKLSTPPRDDRGLPDLHLQLYLDLIAFDHVRKLALVITHVRPAEHASLDAAYDAGCAKLDDLVRRLETPVPRLPGGLELAVGQVELTTPPPPLPVSTLGEGGYQRAVHRIKQYIAAGDAFQVVPSQRFDLVTRVDPFDIYRTLRVVNPSPYMFYLQIAGGMLVGSSPEILVRVEDGFITNRPLAGTRRRGATPAEDDALAAELLADPKERAEHIMLVDLGRNDVGRAAALGTVRYPHVMQIERYSHVMHISSTVTGQLAAGQTCWDALRYSLPVGTVSGSPKVRAMQIIDELEPTRRGPYAGAVGYADLHGNLDMAIALRTMVITPRRDDSAHPWNVYLQAGGGIVADSDPDAEHQETLNKAAAMAKAVHLAQTAFPR